MYYFITWWTCFSKCWYNWKVSKLCPFHIYQKKKNWVQVHFKGWCSWWASLWTETSGIPPNMYCKSGNICGALIFANFAQNSAGANSKPCKNICNILYAHFQHVVCTMCVDAKIASGWYTGASVRPALFLCCPVTCKCIMYHWMMLTWCSTKMASEHLLSVNLTTCEYVFVLPNANKLIPRN